MPDTPIAEVSVQDGVTFVAPAKECESLYENDVRKLCDILLDAAENAVPPLVVVDLQHAKFFGSSFLALLMRASNRLKLREGGRLGLSGLSPYCRTIVEMTRADMLWDIFESREEAIAELANS